jgi:hypothetical protein
VLGGTALATAGALMDPTVKGTFPLREIIGFAGIGFSSVGGLLLLLIERGNVDLLNDARVAVSRWREASDAREQLQRQVAQLAIDVSGQQKSIVAVGVLIQAVESVVAKPDIPLEERLKVLLVQSKPSLMTVVDFHQGDDWTISVFLRQMVDGDERLRRVAALWEDEAAELADKRSWRKSQGWTGAAWARGMPQIEADATSASAKARYDVGENYRPEDDSRFRSVAAVPFRVGADTEVFGVVTATSQRSGSFSADTTTKGGRNVAAIKSLTQLISVVAAATKSTQS